MNLQKDIIIFIKSYKKNIIYKNLLIILLLNLLYAKILIVY